MRDKRAAVNAAALTLLRASNRQDAAFIVNFSDHAFLDQGFTSDIDALNRGLSHYDAKGTTALYDAVAASADELSNHGKLPKQVLLVITDGADNASRMDLQQAIRRVQNLGGPSSTRSVCSSTQKEKRQTGLATILRSSRRKRAALPISRPRCARWTRLRSKSHTTFATSTPLATDQASPRLWAASAWCMRSERG